MGTTDSRPRVRLTHAIYLLVLAAVAISDGRAIEGAAALTAQALGFFLVEAAVLGRLWATLFIAGRKSAELVVDGPYASSRHPLYACSIIGALGIGLSTRSVALTFALPVAIGCSVALAARREDAALSSSHDATWRNYRDAVPAFWPAFWQDRLPETVAVSTRIYRRAFLDAASFLTLWLSVLLIDGLHAGGAWASLFRLP